MMPALRKFLWSIALLAIVTSRAAAQFDDLPLGPEVVAKAEASRDNAPPGGTVGLEIALDVKEKAHIYAVDGPSQQATRFEVDGPGTLSEPVWPEAHLVEGLEAYEGKIVVRIDYLVPAGAIPDSTFTVKGRARGQICDTTCREFESAWTFQVSVDPREVDVHATPSKTGGAPGETIGVALEFRVPDAAHVYSEDSDLGQRGRFALEGPGKLGEASYPEPTGDHASHEGEFTVRIDYTVPSDAKPGRLFVDGRCQGSICDENGCWEYDAPWWFALDVAPGGRGAPAPPVEVGALPPPAGVTGIDWGSLLGLVLPSIGFALAALVMPCTYPMIPITIGVFTKGGRSSRWAALVRALVYGFGIIASYTLLGLVFDLLFGRRGQDEIQAIALNPWLNLAIAALFAYFAGAFFGFYELRLPSFVQQGASQSQAVLLGSMTLPGVFLLGTLFMITSYSCGAPFVLNLFTTAAAEPTRFAVTFALFVFSATMALPFVALALVPNAMQSLPSSGGWMGTFKVVFGFLEFAFALKFLSNTDIYFGDGWPYILNRDAFLGFWCAIAVLIVVYLFGKIRFPHDQPAERVGAGRALWIALFLFLAVYLWSGTKGNLLYPDLEAFLPPTPRAEAAENAAPIRYLESWDQGRLEAARSGKPIFINFTGHT